MEDKQQLKAKLIDFVNDAIPENYFSFAYGIEFFLKIPGFRRFNRWIISQEKIVMAIDDKGVEVLTISIWAIESPQAALDFLDRNLNRTNSSTIRVLRGRILYSLERYSEAFDDFGLVLGLEPKYCDIAILNMSACLQYLPDGAVDRLLENLITASHTHPNSGTIKAWRDYCQELGKQPLKLPASEVF